MKNTHTHILRISGLLRTPEVHLPENRKYENTRKNRISAKTENIPETLLEGLRIIFLCIKDFRRTDSQNRKPFVMRIIGDEKLLNIGLLCLKNTRLQQRQQFCSTQRAEQKASKEQYKQQCLSAAAAAAASCRSSQQQPAPNRQTCDITCAPRPL